MNPVRKVWNQNEKSESEHDVVDCEIVHVYFHWLDDMSSMKLS